MAHSNLGTSNLSVMVGLKAALDFFHPVDPERIFARIHALGKPARNRLAEHKQLRPLNASADAFHTGLASFEPTRGDLKKVIAECNSRHIRIVSDPRRIRVATHMFTQAGEVRTFLEAVERGV